MKSGPFCGLRNPNLLLNNTQLVNWSTRRYLCSSFQKKDIHFTIPTNSLLVHREASVLAGELPQYVCGSTARAPGI